MKKKMFIPFIMLSFLLLTGCGNGANQKANSDTKSATHAHEGEGHEGEDHDEELEGMAVLSVVQRKAINLTVSKLPKRAMSNIVRANGQLEVSPKDKSEVISYLGGNVKQIFVFEGDFVKKGQILAQLEHPDFIQLQQEFIAAYSKLNYLKKEFDRQEELYRNQVGSGKNFQRIEAGYRTAKSTYQGLKLRLEMMGVKTKRILEGDMMRKLPILAPIAGYITAVNTSLGDYVDAKESMFRIVNTTNIHADITVYEKDASKIKIGQKVRIQLSNANQEMDGQIFAIAKAYTAENRSVLIHATLLGDKSTLIADSYLSAEILLGSKEVTAVPEAAIVQDGGKNYVFLKDKVTAELHDGEWAFSKHEVIVGITQNGWKEITFVHPPSATAQVVLKGAYYLLSDLQKSEAKHEH